MFRDVFQHRLAGANVLAAATGRQGAALDLTYSVRVRPASDPAAFVAELNRLEGIQAVELNLM